MLKTIQPFGLIPKGNEYSTEVVMTEMRVMNAISSWIRLERCAPGEEILPTRLLTDLEIGSLELQELMYSLAREFRMELSSDCFVGETVGELVAYVVLCAEERAAGKG